MQLYVCILNAVTNDECDNDIKELIFFFLSFVNRSRAKRNAMFTDIDAKSVYKECITEAINTCHGPSDFN